DQRGVARPFGLTGDIGAYELEASDLGGRITTMQISGHTTNTIPVTNVVVMALGDDGITRTNVSKADGTYRFVSLPSGTYDITPSSPNYVFTPSSYFSVELSTSEYDLDFTAVIAASITGRVFVITQDG